MGFIALAATVLIMGCGGSGAAPASVDVPDSIKTLMANEFPADGQVHVQSQGAFVVNNETMFCRYPNGLMVQPEAANELFKKLGQPTTLKGGYPRANGKVSVDRECDLPNQMFVKGGQTTNRQGKPYKLVLAVWQGDVEEGKGAYWVGGVERVDGNYPVEGRAFHPGDRLESFGEDNITKTKEYDIGQLSQSFVKHATRGVLK
jgi:hypothetical protein